MCVCGQVSFEDVIAEPLSVRTGDRVWFWSNALFEVSRVWFYRIITAVLAIPFSIIAGVLFAFLTCLHIWYEHLFHLISISGFWNNLWCCRGELNVRHRHFTSYWWAGDVKSQHLHTAYIKGTVGPKNYLPLNRIHLVPLLLQWIYEANKLFWLIIWTWTWP